MPSFEYEVNGIAELSRRIPKEYYQSAFISAFGQHLIQSIFFLDPIQKLKRDDTFNRIVLI